MAWYIYPLMAVIVSGIVGWHINRLQDSCGEMVGMMAGMTMGMLNGLIIGFGTAAATDSMFWSNAVGMLGGLLVGGYYGRAGGLLGVMDGGMGGVMGGSMGAMLSLMVRFPVEGFLWTAALLAGLYLLGMIALVVLMEQRSPERSTYHRLTPLFARPAIPRPAALSRNGSDGPGGRDLAAPAARPRRLVDYYAFLGIDPDASEDEIRAAYEARSAGADPTTAARAERAARVLADPEQRRKYDAALAASGAGQMPLAAARPRR